MANTKFWKRHTSAKTVDVVFNISRVSIPVLDEPISISLCSESDERFKIHLSVAEARQLMTSLQRYTEVDV